MKAAVLFVDDEAHILASLFASLRKQFEITTALGPEEGLKAVRAKGPFAVVVSDLKMPGMDGVGFLSRVRELSPDTTRIMLTGHADLGTAIEALNQGLVFRFLTKPCPSDDLANSLRAGIEQHRLILSGRELQHELVKQRDRLENILTATNAGTWEWNVQTGETAFNEIWARIVGYTLEELTPFSIETWKSLAHPEDLKLSYQLLAKHFAGELPYYDFECRMKHKKGKWIWVHDRGRLVTRTNNGDPLLMFGTHQDITERKRGDEALRESEARIRSITDTAHDAIVMMDSDGRISFWNPAAERIFGFARDEALGRDLHNLISPDRYREAFQKALPDFRLYGRGDALGKTLDLSARRKNGEEFSVSLSLSSLEIQGCWHAVGIIHDISERKEIEKKLLESSHQMKMKNTELDTALHQAESATRAKSEFLANMSHEIRTPMNGVIGATELLLDSNLTGAQRRYAETIHSCGESLLNLINDILDFSKIEAGKLILETLDFDLRVMLDEFAATMAPHASGKGLQLLYQVEPEVPKSLRGDPSRLRQILNNLVGNSIKFTHKGEVVVRVSLATNHEVDCVLRFSIRDTGIGIPEDKVSLLFDKFSQVDASTTRQYGGTGLGLAISRQLAQMMHGEIGVNSREGHGSEFWFTVRLGRRPDGPGGAAPGHKTFQDLRSLAGGTAQRLQTVTPLSPTRDLLGIFADRGRILLVEDNYSNQQVALGILDKFGFQADVATNGKQALDALEANIYDLVLMDVQMPEMDGLEATRIIRDPLSSALNHEIPIIAMTANAMEGDREKCLEAGMNDYVSKPISSRKLLQALNKWLQLKFGGSIDQYSSGSEYPAHFSAGVRHPKVFDMAGMMRRVMANESLAQMMIKDFIVDFPNQVATLRDYLEAGDPSGVERQCHTIKGIAANVGGDILRSVAFEMENLARAGDLKSVVDRMGDIEAQFYLLKNEMEKMRSMEPGNKT